MSLANQHGFYNGILYAKNVDFSRSSSVTPQMVNDGQILVGSTTPPNIRTMQIVAGTGVSINYDFTPGFETVTFSAVDGGFGWNNVITPTQLLAVNQGYVTNLLAGVIYSLPATANFGEEIWITGLQGNWSVAQAAGQQILLGPNASTLGNTGSINSNDPSDTVQLLCVVGGAATVWRALGSWGNITFT